MRKHTYLRYRRILGITKAILVILIMILKIVMMFKSVQGPVTGKRAV